MSQTVITSAFEQLKAQQAANGGVVILDEFVFANIPDLNITDPIDRTEQLPDASMIVHRQDVGKTGMVNNNAVVYSVVMGADIGDFAFNWVGLVSKTTGVVAMIVHAPVQKKFKTTAGQQGNVLTRSFLMEYTGASEQTQIITPADTWQIDFTARLNGVDERSRLENQDIYGQASFFGDGFRVSKNGAQYSVAPGVGYVAGLRADLIYRQNINVSKLPVKVWADVSWKGTLTSVWGSVTKIVVAENLSDYHENDAQHYVTAIAEIDARGNIIDLRPDASIATLPLRLASYDIGDGTDLMEWRRKKLADTISGLSRFLAGRSISLYEFTDRITNKNNNSDPSFWDWTPALKALLENALTYNSLAVSSGIAYRNMSVHCPGGHYQIGEELSITDPTTATSVGEKMSINIYGDGPNATVFACAIPGMTLFNIQSSVHLSDFGLRGFRAADGSSTTTLMVLGDLTGNNPVSGSSFRRLKCNYSHHNIVINHAYDCYFEQINIHDIPGGKLNDESTAIDIKAVLKDNSNNLFFNKVHLEQAYGSYVTFLRTRKPTTDGSYHHTLDFTGLHVETRRYDARNLDLEGVITSGFRGLHFVRNNTRGGVTTYKVSRRILTLKDCNNLSFSDGLFSHSGDSFDDMIAPILHTGTVKNVVYERMRIVTGNTNVSDLDSYLTNESTDVLLIASVFRDCLFNNFDTSVLVNTLIKLSSRKRINRAHYMTVDDNGWLINSYSNSADGLSKKDISRLTNDGDLSVASRSAPSLVTVEAGSAITYILPNPAAKNANKRGVVTLLSKNNLSTGTAIFTTSGGDLKEHINGGLYKIKATTDRASGYINVSLSGGNLLIENLTANPFSFGMDFLGFMD